MCVCVCVCVCVCFSIVFWHIVSYVPVLHYCALDILTLLAVLQVPVLY